MAGPATAAVMIGMGTTYDGVAQVNSAGIWALTGSWLLVLATGINDETTVRGLLAASIPIGLVGGGVWRKNAPLPRWRTTLLDTGAAIGMFGAAGVAVVFAGTEHGARPVGIAAAAGMIGGAVAAHMLAPRLERFFVVQGKDEASWRLGPRLMGDERGSVPGLAASLRW